MAEMTLRDSTLANRARVQSLSNFQLARALVNVRWSLDLAAIHHGKDWAWLCVSVGQIRAEMARRARDADALAAFLVPSAVPVLQSLARAALDQEAARVVYDPLPGSTRGPSRFGPGRLLAYMRGAVAALKLLGHAEAAAADDCVRLVLAKTLAPDVILASWAAGVLPTAEALRKLREVDSAAAVRRAAALASIQA